MNAFARISLVCGSALPLILTACRPAATGEVPGLSTAAMADDRDAARLCGYLALEPEVPMRVPLPAGLDTTSALRMLAYLEGPGVRGLRVLAPGDSARYVFRGVSTDGHTRVSLVRALPTGVSAATIAANPAPFVAMLRALDSTVVHWVARDTSQQGRLPAALPDSSVEPDRAVPDIRRLPDSRLLLTPACPVVTIGTQSMARIERIFRVLVPENGTLVARARGAQAGVVLSFDRPAIADSGRANVRRVWMDSVHVTAAREVTVRVTSVPVPRKEPDASFVTLSLVLR